MSNLLQFQAHNWISVMREKNWKMQKPILQQTKVLGGKYNLWNLPSDSRKVWNCQNKFWRSLLFINFSSTFLLLKNCLPKLQRKQICTAVRYIQINQLIVHYMVLKSFLEFVLLVPWPLTPMFVISVLMCWAENWWRKLSQKIFEKIHICLHFNIKNSPILTALIMTSFTNWGWQWIVWIKSFVISAVWQTCHRRTDLCNICRTSY